MLDNRQMAEEPAEVVESPTTETEKVETPVEETPEIEKENSETPKEEETPAEPEKEPAKPSRAEKKIRDLWKENAELKARMDELSQRQSPEFESGEIDAKTLDSVINQRAIEAARLIVESQSLGHELKTQAQEWATDLEKVIGENPELNPKSPEYDNELAETLARALSDNQGQARFDLKPSDLIRVIKRRESNVTTKAKEEGKSEVTASLAKQSQEGAITPSSKTSKTAEYTDDEISKIQQTNPRLYTELVMSGKI
jgi:hypothetical protein